MPDELPEEDRRDLLAYASFRVAPRSPSPEEPPSPQEDTTIAAVTLTHLVQEEGVRRLEQRFVERLVPRVGIPLDVKVFARRGSVELGVLILGSYALLKDYKPLRESLDLLVEDIANVLGTKPNGMYPRWQVTLEDVRTPGSAVPDTLGGFVGMGVVSRYAWVYLLIINFLVLIFFCYLTLTTVMANT
jgi:hypothetical protein